MESNHEFIEDGSRYEYDAALIPEGYRQLDSEQDALYFGTWFDPHTLTLVEYAEGDLTTLKFDDAKEFVNWAAERRETMRYLHIDDWERAEVIPITRITLLGYLATFRRPTQ